MQRQYRLCKGSEFQAVQKCGLSRANPYLVLRAAPNNREHSRFGFVVGGRAVRGAVLRNRVKRRLREVARLTPVKGGWDIVFIARHRAITAKFAQLQQAARELLKQAQLVQDCATAFGRQG